MQDLIEVDHDAPVDLKNLNDQTQESRMNKYQELEIGDIIYPENYLFQIERSHRSRNNIKIKDDLETSNHAISNINDERILKISSEEMDFLHRALVLLHVISKVNDANKITNLLNKLVVCSENN